jgi:hypothetical protein
MQLFTTMAIESQASRMILGIGCGLALNRFWISVDENLPFRGNLNASCGVEAFEAQCLP